MKNVFLSLVSTLLLLTSCSTNSTPKKEEVRVEKQTTALGEYLESIDSLSEESSDFTIGNVPNSNAVSSFSFPEPSKNQVFKVDPTKDIEVKGIEGVVIKIPAGSLVNSNGKKVTEQVRIDLKEYVSLESMLKKGLSTMSNGKLLETGGMINLKVSSASGEELKMDAQSSYQAFFPKKTEGMSTFTGSVQQDGSVNWVEDKKASALNVTDNYVTVNEKIPFSNIGKCLQAEHLNEIKVAKLANQSIPMNGSFSVKIFIDKQGNYEKMSVNPDVQSSYAAISSFIGEEGVVNFNSLGAKQTVERVAMIKNQSAIYKALDQSLKQTSVWLLPSQNKFNWNSHWSIQETKNGFVLKPKNITDLPVSYLPNLSESDTGYTKTVFKKCTLLALKGQGTYPVKKRISSVRDLKNYTRLTLTSFNWINCDRFMQNQELTPMYVSNENCKGLEVTTYLVFMSQKSIISGNLRNNKYTFGKVPLKGDVRLVSVGFDPEKKQFLFSNQEVSFAKRNKLSIDFKVVSSSELEANIKNLKTGIWEI